VFIGAPAGSGLLTCAELAIFREVQSETFEKIVYLCPSEQLCKLRHHSWKSKLGRVGLTVGLATGNL